MDTPNLKPTMNPPEQTIRKRGKRAGISHRKRVELAILANKTQLPQTQSSTSNLPLSQTPNTTSSRPPFSRTPNTTSSRPPFLRTPNTTSSRPPLFPTIGNIPGNLLLLPTISPLQAFNRFPGGLVIFPTTPSLQTPSSIPSLLSLKLAVPPPNVDIPKKKIKRGGVKRRQRRERRELEALKLNNPPSESQDNKPSLSAMSCPRTNWYRPALIDLQPPLGSDYHYKRLAHRYQDSQNTPGISQDEVQIIEDSTCPNLTFYKPHPAFPTP